MVGSFHVPFTVWRKRPHMLLMACSWVRLAAWRWDWAVRVKVTVTMNSGLSASCLTSDFFCSCWAYYDVLSSSAVQKCRFSELRACELFCHADSIWTWPKGKPLIRVCYSTPAHSCYLWMFVSLLLCNIVISMQFLWHRTFLLAFCFASYNSTARTYTIFPTLMMLGHMWNDGLRWTETWKTKMVCSEILHQPGLNVCLLRGLIWFVLGKCNKFWKAPGRIMNPHLETRLGTLYLAFKWCWLIINKKFWRLNCSL